MRVLVFSVLWACWFAACLPLLAQNGMYFDKTSYSGGAVPDWNATKGNIPVPIVDANPEWVTMYWKAWEIAYGNYKVPAAGSGLVSNYLDEAFDNNLYQWDTIFMMQFAKYNHHQFEAIESLDNFYHAQRNNGFIARSFSETSATSALECEDCVNPPIFAWVEWEYYLYTGDASRLSRVLLPLEKYGEWLELNRKKTGNSLYWNTPLGSGMDNTPRRGDAWICMSIQMQMHYKYLALIAGQTGDATKQAEYQTKADQIVAMVNATLWSEQDGMYFDTDSSGNLVKRNTIAGFWPLLSDAASPQQVRALVEHLRNPAEYDRTFPFPSLAANDTLYAAQGDYWRGGSWAPNTYVVIKGLEQAGFPEMAYQQSEKYIQALSSVFANTNTLWENYAPDSLSEGNISRADFVGWTGLGPIALLIENVIGIQSNIPQNMVEWDVRRTDRHGVTGYRLGSSRVDFICDQRAGQDVPPRITVNTATGFTLRVRWKGGVYDYAISGGGSQVIDLATIPILPPRLQVVQLTSSLQASVSWSSSTSSGITGYDVYRCDSSLPEFMENRWKKIASTGASVSQIVDVLSQADQALGYQYHVVAKAGSHCSQPSNALSLETGAPQFDIVPPSGIFFPYGELAIELNTSELLDFSWDLGDGTMQQGGTLARHRYIQSGTYLIKVTGKNAAGVSLTKTHKITINLPQDVPEILLVVGSQTLLKAEKEMMDYLQLGGYSVQIVVDSLSSTADANQKALVIISSSVSSANVGTKFRDVSVPVMVYEGFLMDDMAMTGAVFDTDYGKVGGQKKIAVTGATTLSHGLPIGSHVVYLQNSFVTWGKPAAGSEIIATVEGDSSKACIFTYAQGIQMIGMNAPAKRMGIFLENDGAAQLTERGWTLFDAAVGWLVNSPPEATLAVSSVSVEVGNSIALTVLANDSDGAVSSVIFYADGQELGSDTTAPYTLNWTPQFVGAKEVWAHVTDDSGNVIRTSVKNIEVMGAYHAWRSTHSLPQANGQVSDFDEDQLDDYLEYAYGLNPRVPDIGGSGFLNAQQNGLNWTLSTEAPNDPAVDYAIQYSTDLSRWRDFAEQELTRDTGVGQGTTTYSLELNPNNVERLFWRIHVREPGVLPSYSQDFDSLSGTMGVDQNWQDDTTIRGGYSNYLQLRHSDGSGGTLNNAGFGRLVAFGNGSDWALGATHHIFSGSTIRFGIRLVNKSGGLIDRIRISYDGEQWRRGQSDTESIQKLAFSYAIESASLVIGDYVRWEDLDFLSKSNVGSGAGLDGNIQSEKNIAGFLTGLNWQPGQSLWLVWDDVNDTGNDHGLSVDNLKVWAYSNGALLTGSNDGDLFLSAK